MTDLSKIFTLKKKSIFHIPFGWRTFSAFFYDVVAAIAAMHIAFSLRFNFDIPPDFSATMLKTISWAVPIQIAIFILNGLYKGVWRFASIPDLKRIVVAIGLSSVVIVAVLYMVKPTGVVPRSVLVLDPILLLLLAGGGRLAYRAWKDHKLYSLTATKGQPVLVLGSGEAAIGLLKSLARSQEWCVVGILDNDRTMHDRQLFGVRVMGAFHDMARLASALGVKHIIFATPQHTNAERREVVRMANESGLTVLTVPTFDELMSGKVSVSKVRRVDVEDLLGRDKVVLDTHGLHSLIEGRAVLVSGAGGSIGSELCRQIIKYEPQLLICLDISELALYKLEQELHDHVPGINVKFVVGDVRQEKRIRSIIGKYKPSVIFHAAAYKHVPMMESDNVSEALQNNVYGTYILAKIAKEAHVEKFVMVSTDKAVNPTNVMGASKRLAEMVCQGLQEKAGTRFVIVRFGNVLGSSGSVIPKFREQIAKGGPITVTHPEITRYFMSIPEAAQLVMQAGLMGTGAEIFVLDMGESVRIVDLAKDMIKLSGLHEDEIEIQFTGLRPGEKLYEELLADDEHTLPTHHEKLRIAVARTADSAWVKALLKWVDASIVADEDTIKQELSMWVEEYVGDINAIKPESKPALAPRSSTIH